MAVEGIEHLINRHKVDYLDALPVAVLGLIVNLASAMILGKHHHYGHGHGHGHGHDHDHDHDHEHHHREKPKAGTIDFNLRAAYIHILADAMTSLMAIVALSLGLWMKWWFLDPIMGLVGGAVIIWWSISLCRMASRQLLDVVSSPAHEQVVRDRLEAIDDVRVADLHVWELGPGRRSCIISLVTSVPRDVAFYRDTVLDALDVAHLTIEIHRCELAHHDGDVGAEVAHHHEH